MALGTVLRTLVVVAVAAAVVAGAGKAAGLWGAAPKAVYRIPVAGPPADPAVLSRIASGIARRRVTVVCSSSGLGGGRLGSVPAHGRAASHATLARDVCLDLGQLARGLTQWESECVLAAAGLCDGVVNQSVRSAQVLAHEAYHLYGIVDEAATDCYALQSVEDVVLALGVAPELAQALASYYARHYDAVRFGLRRYWSDECEDGGKLDLRPASADWPS